MTPPVIDVNVKGQQLNIKAEEFVPNNSIEVVLSYRYSGSFELYALADCMRNR
jgi:HSP20 family molecular chaperone IbpA